MLKALTNSNYDWRRMFHATKIDTQESSDVPLRQRKSYELLKWGNLEHSESDSEPITKAAVRLAATW